MARKSPAKVLQKTTRRGSSDKPSGVELKDQYQIIRDDLIKLRSDLVKGYDMARRWMDQHGSVKSFLKAK